MALVETAVAAPAPSVTRAVPVHAGTSDDGNFFAFPSGSHVVVMDLRTRSTLVCAHHHAQVTVARLSPGGQYCASGDKDGNVIVWANKAAMVVAYQGKLIGGPVRDIAWSEDDERIIAVGEGKTMAAAIAVNGGNTLGTFLGHQRTITTCDFRRARPFRIITGAQDTQVNIYEGPPFKFTKSITGQHTGNINCVRFNRDSSLCASVSGGADVVLHDGKTADVVRSFPTGHAGSIYCLAWSPDGAKIATASADKSVKIFDVSTGAQISSHSFGTTVAAMQQSVCFSSIGVLSIGLNGDINVIGPASADGSAAAAVTTWRGHARPIVALYPCSTPGSVVSLSVDGRVLHWAFDGAASKAEPIGDGLTDIILGATFNADSVTSYGGPNLIRYDTAAKTAAVISTTAESPTAMAQLAGDLHVLVYRAAVAVYRAGVKVWEEKVAGLDGSSAAASPSGTHFAVGGDKLVRVYEWNGAKAELKTVLQGRHQFTVSAVAFNASGAQLATGDSNRQIFVWDLVTGEVVFDELVFHSSKITSLVFAPDDSALASGSTDCSIIVWNLPLKKRVIVAAAHAGSVAALCWANSTTLVSGGVDGFVRKWQVTVPT